MRKILVGILVGGSLALATSAAFADPESTGLGGQVFTRPSVQATAGIPTVGGGQGYVYGPVLQKLTPHEDTYSITVGSYGSSENYSVPMSFYDRVQVGDVVKFDGGEWTVVKRAPSTW